MTPGRDAGIDDVVVLTGATSGIGRVAAFEIAPRVNHLILQGLEPANRVDDLLTVLRAEIRLVAARGADNGAYHDERSSSSPNPESLGERSQDWLHAITMGLLRQASLLR